MAGRNQKQLELTPTTRMKRTIRYAVVPADRVFNWLAPMNVTCWGNCPKLHKTWWSDETVALRKEFQRLYMEKFDRFQGHFSKLEQSMLKDGFHAPVSTVTGPPRGMYQRDVFPKKVLPPEWRDDPDRALCTHTFGGSRVMVAQKHNISIPCLIYDYTDAFKDEQVLRTPGDIQKRFNNTYSVGAMNSPVIVRAIKHSHLGNKTHDGQERNNRHKVIAEIKKELGV